MVLKKEKEYFIIIMEQEKYEGDFKNDLFEGKGIYYYANGDRVMGNYLNGVRKGKHVKLHANGEVTSEIFF